MCKLILPLKPLEKVYKIDAMVADHGHTVIRLPPYMCDLNPTELAWAKIKRPVRENKVTADMNLQKLLQVAEDSLSHVTKDDCQGYCKDVETLWKECWERDRVVPDVIGNIILHLNRDSDIDCDSDRGSSDTKDRSDCSSSEGTELGVTQCCSVSDINVFARIVVATV